MYKIRSKFLKFKKIGQIEAQEELNGEGFRASKYLERSDSSYLLPKFAENYCKKYILSAKTEIHSCHCMKISKKNKFNKETTSN